jgi:hypothetical protein
MTATPSKVSIGSDVQMCIHNNSLDPQKIDFVFFVVDCFNVVDDDEEE